MTGANRELGEELSDITKLSEPRNVKAPIGITIKSRRSVRKYAVAKMEEWELSTLLYYAQGVSGEAKITGVPAGPDNIKLRNMPSGGGTYPVHLYCVVQQVNGIEDGIYLYYPYSHSLKPVSKLKNSEEILKYAEFGSINANDVNVVVFLCLRYVREFKKIW